MLTTIRFTREEERDLFFRMEAGDAEAKDLLARSVMAWACKVALRFRDHGIDDDELIALGYYAVAHVLQPGRFHPDKGRLTTLLFYQVRNAVIRATETRTVIRVPDGSPYEAHAKSARRVITLGNSRLRSKAIFSRDPEKTPAALCADAEDLAVKRSVLKSAMEYIRRKNPRAAVILRRRFQGDTLAAIGKDLGIHKECVRQIEARWLPRLRERALRNYGRRERAALHRKVRDDSNRNNPRQADGQASHDPAGQVGKTAMRAALSRVG